MSTISVPLSKDREEKLDALILNGAGSSRADVMRRALDRFAEEEAIAAVLEAEKEPTLSGDIRALMKKVSGALELYSQLSLPYCL